MTCSAVSWEVEFYKLMGGRETALTAPALYWNKMPRYYEEKEEENKACAGIREDFKACLLQHDCVLKDRKKPSECLKEGHCRALQVSFFECKRSMLDTRSRFRGRKGY
ncbi:cytochrome c oxidase assembly factor 5 [Arapaima gigas]